MAPLTPSEFAKLRYGLFIHYGLYSQLARGEWVMNKEALTPEDMQQLAASFTAEHFDADALCDFAVRAGMRYVVLTTMHHEGFRLYTTELSDFSAPRSPAGRDLVAELIQAARARGLRVGLYHSLNNWTDKPDSVDALEHPNHYTTFIDNTFARIRELVTRYNPIDILWYDGWWPFNAEGWQAEAMNAMVREIQPHILFNGRNGLPGDFGTPEGHVSAPKPWRPWEACMTLNNNWGYHAGDDNWKSPRAVVEMLAKAANGRGNILLNIGPRGDGSVPEPSVEILEQVGAWLQRYGECIYDTDLFDFDLRERKGSADWCHHGPMTASGKNLYLIATSWPGETCVLSGLTCKVQSVTIPGHSSKPVFEQVGDRLIIRGLPPVQPDPVCGVIRITCDQPPVLYRCGGLRVPSVDHPRYDPCPSDIAH